MASRIGNSILISGAMNYSVANSLITFAAKNPVSIAGNNFTVASNVNVLGNLTSNIVTSNGLIIPGTANIVSLGVGGKLTVSGETNLLGDLNVYGTFQVPGVLRTPGVLSVANTLESTSNTSGAVVISGGLGVAKNVYASGYYYSNGVPASITYAYYSNTVTDRSNNFYSNTYYTTVNAAIATANNAIYENSLIIDTDYTILSDRSAMSVGPITIANNRTVTIYGNWSII